MHAEILALALPNVLSNLSVPLLGAVDTALVGRLEDLSPLGAVAIGAMIFDILYWGFGFLRMGTTGLAAQAYGDGDEVELDRILARALWIAWGGAALLVLLRGPLETLAFSLVDAPLAVGVQAREYFRIRILAAPATLALYAYHGWFLGKQDARSPLAVVFVANLVNVGLDALFVMKYGWGAAGVAAGTVAAQYLGLGLAFVLARVRHGRALPRMLAPGVLEPGALRRLAILNRDIFIRTLCLMGTFSYFTVRSAAGGEAILAANHVLLQFWHLMAYFVDGVAFAGESITGRYHGARDEPRLRRAIRLLFAWGMGLACFCSALYAALGREIVGLFTDKQPLVDLAMGYQVWCVLAPPVNAAAFIWDGVYIGVTASVAMRNSMLLSTFLVFLPVEYLSRESLGNHGLWFALTLFMAARALSLTWLAPRYVYGSAREPLSGPPQGPSDM